MRNQFKRILKIKGQMGNAKWVEALDDDGTTSALMAVMANPDFLSTEQALYDERDFDAEESRAEYLEMFKIAYETLTDRQREIVRFLAVCDNQETVANYLNIKQNTLSISLKQIQKKISKHIDKQRKARYKVTEGEDFEN